MIEIGYYSLFIAFILSIYSASAAVFGGRTQNTPLVKSAENAALAISVFYTLALIVLAHALVTRNFQVEYVFKYTSRSLPLHYTLTAFYAGQEGSLLFWGWLLAIFSALIIFQNRNKNRDLLPYVLAVMMIVTFFFTLLMVFITNPFQLLNYSPPDGRGLNPLLQNPGMIFHPPTLFIGYVGLTVPFAFSIAALITGQLGSIWIRTTRKWTLVSWLFLTAGIVLGMEWAYVELGWGGYWAWDPVENASFMPWIVATAYFHSVIIQEKRDMLKVWNISLILFSFLLTLFGTFITRSGLIASVHSFGQSSLGWLFLLFLGIVLILSLALLFYRLPKLQSKNQLDSYLSRASSFLYNNLIFVGIAFTVLWGTLFPIISEAVRGTKITVGPPFFNSVIIPITLALIFLTGICPLIAWRRSSLKNFLKKLLAPGAISLTGAAILFFSGIGPGYALLSFSLCLFVLTTISLEFFNGTRARHKMLHENYFMALWNLIVKNKRRHGGYVVHAGIIVAFVAITGSAFNTEKQVTMNPGESIQINSYNLTYDGLAKYPTANQEKVVATITVRNKDRKIVVLSPEKSLFYGQDQPTTEVAIHSNLKEDLYIILAGYTGNSATLKILVNPLVIWLWIGGGIMACGIIIILLPERKKRTTI
ncbi:MAG: heme lyase CcmF/NrfE family subunit [Desulfobacterales bacterium]|nr:heme lyase CcmF/NrfE family subunit [Desulfobacterales bacterium]